MIKCWINALANVFCNTKCLMTSHITGKLHCLFNILHGLTAKKKTPTLSFELWGNPPVVRGFLSQRVSNAVFHTANLLWPCGHYKVNTQGQHQYSEIVVSSATILPAGIGLKTRVAPSEVITQIRPDRCWGPLVGRPVLALIILCARQRARGSAPGCHIGPVLLNSY